LSDSSFALSWGRWTDEGDEGCRESEASSVHQLRRQATDLLRQLSPERLKVAIEFLAF